MYIIDGIAYANGFNKGNLKITSAKVVNNLTILVTFSNGEKRIFDAKYLLDIPAFKDLENESIFKNFSIVHGTLTWNNENIDISPTYVYNNSFVYEYI